MAYTPQQLAALQAMFQSGGQGMAPAGVGGAAGATGPSFQGPPGPPPGVGAQPMPFNGPMPSFDLPNAPPGGGPGAMPYGGPQFSPQEVPPQGRDPGFGPMPTRPDPEPGRKFAPQPRDGFDPGPDPGRNRYHGSGGQGMRNEASDALRQGMAARQAITGDPGFNPGDDQSNPDVQRRMKLIQSILSHFQG